MMKYKVIASDMDETLLNDQHVICQRNIDLIKKAKEKGVKFVPATGRGFMSIQRDLKLLGLYDVEKEYVLSFNGGALTENKNNQLLYFEGLSFEKTKEIFEFGLHQDVCQHIYTKDKVYVFNLSESEAQRIHDQKVECEIMEENSMDFLKDVPISKILYQNVDVPYLMSLEPQMQDIVKGTCAVSYSSNRYMEFNKIGVDKGQGLKHLAEIIGVDLSECIAVGDNYNDLPMLKVAGLSVAAANAVDDVKKACDIVTEADNNQGVIAEIVERFIL